MPLLLLWRKSRGNVASENQPKKGKPPDWLVAHRELEYLRAAGSVPKKQNAKQRAARKRVKERYKKLREVNFDD